MAKTNQTTRQRSNARNAGTPSLPRARYLDHLDAQWKLARKRRRKDAPTVVSTFSSAGGSSLGYHMAGMREVLAVEWDDNKVKTFTANFPKIPLFHGDIHDLSVEQALELSGLQPGELDIFDGSPPCQGFSLAGHRILNDSRNTLFREYVRLLKGFQPKAFVFENVKGMITGKMKPVFRQVMEELEASGYRIRTQVLTASWFGVPQNRQRVYIVGIRNDLKAIPPVIHGTRRAVAAGEACMGAGSVVPLTNLSGTYGKWWGHIPVGKAANAIDPSGNGYTSMQKLDPEKPAPTLKALSNPVSGYGAAIHWNEARVLSIAEGKRLSSFPDQFRILPDSQVTSNDYVTAWEAIGDCVPPFMAAGVARQILEVLNGST